MGHPRASRGCTGVPHFLGWLLNLLHGSWMTEYRQESALFSRPLQEGWALSWLAHIDYRDGCG